MKLSLAKLSHVVPIDPVLVSVLVNLESVPHEPGSKRGLHTPDQTTDGICMPKGVEPVTFRKDVAG